MRPLAFCLIVFFQQLHAQNIITVYGVVSNGSTGDPVPWASISIKDRSIGTLAGDSGNFKLHLPNVLLRDTLIISSLGFRNLKVCVYDVAGGRVMKFTLTEETTKLSEIIIRSKQLSAKEIMKRAYKEISKNYPQQSYMMSAFYRDYKKVNGQYVSLLEAATKIYDKGYSDKNQEEIAIEEIRRSKRFVNPYEPFVSSWNLLGSLMGMNDVKYRTRSLNIHGSRYRLDTTMVYNGEPVYVISSGKHRLFKIFVRESDYGIIRIEYSGDFREVKHPSNHLVNDSVEYVITDIQCLIEFRDYQDKLYLSHMRYSWNTTDRNIKSKASLYDTYFSQQLIVNDITANAIRNQQRVMGDTTLELQAEKYNEEFWATYNIPQMDDELDAVLTDLVKDSKGIPFERKLDAIAPVETALIRDSCYRLETPSAKIYCLLSRYHDKYKVPASQMSVMHKGRLVYSDAVGFVDLHNQVPATTGSVFRIASVSKTITAFLALQLVERKQLNLTQPIGIYLPELSATLRKVTPYQLGTNTGGIRDYKGFDDFYRSIQYRSMRESLTIFKDDSLLFKPGEDFSYTSFGFNLLGATIEGATGKNYLELIEEIVTRPLSMKSTKGSNVGDASTTQYYVLKDGYRVDAPEENLSYKWSSGGLTSTTDDLVKFGQEVLVKINNNKWFRDMVSTPPTLPSGETSTYSFGWYTDTDATGEIVIHHPGSAPGYSSHLLIYPDKEIVIAYLANTGINCFFNKVFADKIVLLLK